MKTNAIINLRNIIIIVLLAAVFVSHVSISSAGSVPPLPNTFSGTVKLVNSSGQFDAPPGTLIEAFIDNVTKGDTLVTAAGKYSIDVIGTDEDDGKGIIFKVNNLSVEQKAIFNTSMPRPQTLNLLVNLPSSTSTILSFTPEPPVLDVIGAARTFNIKVNQIVNFTWYINGTEVFNQTNLNQSTYTNASAALGTWNVTAVAQNANGTTMQIWDWTVTVPPIAGVPVVISWSNNKTNDASLNIAANVSETIRFNATANQSIDTWNWFLNNINQNTNSDNFSHYFAAPGNYIIKVNASNTNGTSDTVAWNVNMTGVTPPTGTPNITSFSPPTTTVTNNVGDSRTFSITTNQTMNVSWLINGTEVFNETGVITSSYTNSSAALGTWNVTAVASNNNGSDIQTWTWVAQQIMVQGAPEITSFTPASPVNDIVGATRTFTVNVNQTTNVTWYINETEVFNQSSVTQSSYTNTSAALGAMNVIAIVVNENGSGRQTWVWTVTPVPTSGGSISGMKFNDLNGNGTRDIGEPGLSNWTIVLTRPDSSNETAITNLDGTYIFSNLSAGNYTVGEVQQGWKQTAPSTGTYNVTITSAGENVTGKDFGNMLTPPPKLGSISGMKFNDLNGNGTRDMGEPGLPNWTITLKTGTGTTIATALTDKNGTYKFSNLSAGNYIVGEVLQPGWTQTAPNNKPPGIYTVTITSAGEDVIGKDFGNMQVLQATFNISGFKLNGATGNGIQDWLISAENATTGAPIFNTTTNAAGMYLIPNLTNGTYTVVEETRAGFTPNGSTSQNITIAGHDAKSVNFTNTPVTPAKLGSISGMKWNDLNGDGIRQTNEPGLANWTILLLKNTGKLSVIFNTTTDAEGNYMFSGLSEGNYTVGEILKPNWIQTAPKPVPPGTYNATITSAGENVTGKDFGNMLLVPPPSSVNGSISGNVINVATGNGLPNVTIRLVGIVGTGVETKSIRMETMTDPMGRWMFDNLPAGRYIIIEQLQKGFIPVSPPVMNPMLAKGQNSMDNNFTNKPVESLIPKLPLPPTPPVMEEQESK